MRHFLQDGATILLTPDGTWSWQGWDGQLTVHSVGNKVFLSGRNMLIEQDVPAFTLQSPRSYTSLVFRDIPGMLDQLECMVDAPTLSRKVAVNDSAPLLITTTGTFICTSVMPAMKVTPVGPVPDPILLKSGTWRIVDPVQQIAGKKMMDVLRMTLAEKMEEAIRRAHLSEELLKEIGDIRTFVASFLVVAGLLAFLGMTGGGLVVEVVGAGLLVAGGVLSVQQMIDGGGHLVDFYTTCNKATTEADLDKAGASFGQGVAKLGVGTVNLAMMKPAIPKNAAIRFYKRMGKTEVKAWSHAQGIDFTKPVAVTTLKKGTRLRQWVRKDGRPGEYFTTLENGDRKNLGMGNYDQRELRTFELDKDYEVLESTAAAFQGHEGGGKQFVIPDFKGKELK